MTNQEQDEKEQGKEQGISRNTQEKEHQRLENERHRFITVEVAVLSTLIGFGGGVAFERHQAEQKYSPVSAYVMQDDGQIHYDSQARKLDIITRDGQHYKLILQPDSYYVRKDFVADHERIRLYQRQAAAADSIKRSQAAALDSLTRAQRAERESLEARMK
jgi:hypothetical protein